jgi:hypothetical protein
MSSDILPDDTRIDNFPVQHSDNCTAKHQLARSWFKPTVRIFKNLRNSLIEARTIPDGLAPSYFIEGLLYNVPPERFGGTEQQNFVDVVNWILATDSCKFLCTNEQYYLCHPTSPATWRAEKLDRFLDAAVKRWEQE